MSNNNLKTYNYTYKIEFKTGHFYFGVRSCKCLPEEDVNYLGSPSTHKNYWKNFISCKTILNTFDTREEANEYENVLIQWGWDACRTFSLNESINGIKFHGLGKKFSAETRAKIAAKAKGRKWSEKSKQKMSESRGKPYRLVSPEGTVYSGANLCKFAEKHGLQANNIIATINGQRLHYRGWTSSIEAHQVYLEYYENRGIRFLAYQFSPWVVAVTTNKKVKRISFKSRESAIDYRDAMEKDGTIFQVNSKGWRKKLAKLQAQNNLLETNV
jgi:hypothetical protein